MSGKENTKQRGYRRSGSEFPKTPGCSEGSMSLTRAACPGGTGDAAKGFQRGQGCWRNDLLVQWECHCGSYATHAILANGFSASNKQEWIISDTPLRIKFKPGAAESPSQSEFMKWKNVVWVGYSVLARPVNTSRPQLEHCNKSLHLLTQQYPRLVLTQVTVVY